MTMLNYCKLLCVSLALLMNGQALAQSSSLIFERVDMVLTPQTHAGKEGEVTVQRTPFKLNVELRQEDSLRLEYIHTLNSLTAKTGVMVGLNSPAVIALPAMKVYTPVDALFIAEDGAVIQIIPHVILGEMSQAIQASKPSKALLFIKDGQAGLLGITPGDVVNGKIFTPAQAVQG